MPLSTPPRSSGIERALRLQAYCPEEPIRHTGRRDEDRCGQSRPCRIGEGDPVRRVEIVVVLEAIKGVESGKQGLDERRTCT